MSAGLAAKILVVDDVALNVKLLADLLEAKGYRTVQRDLGRRSARRLDAERPDLILLDVMMPGMSGYDVCREIRAKPAHAMLPIVLVTALDPAEERAKGLDAGADDFLSKPVSQHELLARVRSLLRIKSLYDELLRQRSELAELNRTLEQRVADGVAQLEKVSRLKRFFSPQLAEMIVAGGADDPLKSHRRDITVVFLDLRGFTAFTETADPEDVMAVLGEYHAAVGALVLAHEGTLERFTGDGIMVFFNDPVPVPDPASRACRMAIAMQHEIDAARDRLEAARLRPGDGGRHRPGLRDHRQHRLPGPHRLRRDRHRHQPGRAPVRRGQGRRDPGVAARPRPPRRRAGVRSRRRARAEGFPSPGARVSRSRRRIGVKRRRRVASASSILSTSALESRQGAFIVEV